MEATTDFNPDFTPEGPPKTQTAESSTASASTTPGTGVPVDNEATFRGLLLDALNKIEQIAIALASSEEKAEPMSFIPVERRIIPHVFGYQPNRVDDESMGMQFQLQQLKCRHRQWRACPDCIAKGMALIPDLEGLVDTSHTTDLQRRQIEAEIEAEYENKILQLSYGNEKLRGVLAKIEAGRHRQNKELVWIATLGRVARRQVDRHGAMDPESLRQLLRLARETDKMARAIVKKGKWDAIDDSDSDESDDSDDKSDDCGDDSSSEEASSDGDDSEESRDAEDTGEEAAPEIERVGKSSDVQAKDERDVSHAH
jgi:hypothetical protein